MNIDRSGQPPLGVRTTASSTPGGSRVVLVRHGEARCNVEGVVGGRYGCTGLTSRGVSQVELLASRLARTGELAGVSALFSSVLPRAAESARLLAPALDCWRNGPPLAVHEDCGLCELHPGSADGLDWATFAERFDDPEWDEHPERPIAPGGESWSDFVERASGAVRRIVTAYPAQLVVLVCHAGVIESTLLRFTPVDSRRARLQLRTEHASMTEWEHAEGRWRLLRYNDVVRDAHADLVTAQDLSAQAERPGQQA